MYESMSTPVIFVGMPHALHKGPYNKIVRGGCKMGVWGGQSVK